MSGPKATAAAARTAATGTEPRRKKLSDQQKHLKKKMILTVLLMKYSRSLTLTENLFKNLNLNLQVTHVSELPCKASVKVAVQCISVEAPFHVGLEQILHREHVTDCVV